MLNGDNQYFCDWCEKKLDANRRETFHTLPNLLIIVLKRFEYSIEYGERTKLNSYF